MDKRQHPRRINVLILGKKQHNLQISNVTNAIWILDGGGVRGLSALLILRELMLQINSSLGSKRGTGGLTVEPHHIFHLVAGTGTGGLIAIMLGKLGMNVEECIKSYHTLSRRIFRKKHIRGMITGGLASSKYSGKGFKRCFCNLLKERGYGEELPMKAGSNDKISW
jgi:patatin-like phospholipase/acyl hydrolase